MMRLGGLLLLAYVLSLASFAMVKAMAILLAVEIYGGGVPMGRGGHAVCDHSWLDAGSVLLGRDVASMLKGPRSVVEAMWRWGGESK